MWNLSELGFWAWFWLVVIPLFLLVNVKGLLGVYHIRIFHALFNHLIFNRSRRVNVARHGADALFQPIVTTSRSPLLECDFNGHKSNSTFYSDLDANRMHLFGALFKDVLSPEKRQATSSEPLAKLRLALGGVSCTFKREIKPYEKYQIWSRVLSWDEKWVYIVSYFVRNGAVLPQGYTLQPSRINSAGKRGKNRSSDDVGKAIFASAISKYVFKQGRRTIPPEQVFESINLLPQQPGSAHEASTATASNGQSTTPSRVINGGTVRHEGNGSQIKPSSTLVDECQWDWKRVQEEKQRGFGIASHFASLDELHVLPILPTANALGNFDGVGFY
ncbi:uncharacterized protein BP5553_10348 [Venustampulla echinocandica]|uniref:Thioesterase ester dehydrase-isomerase n=1 Tax=Venustampulla echinocandica TaxID=2656787 RepID=A0A370T9X9_9HELO|nr:uncharacterized protein BP5553_10348 [Venustampulla echinocandica]RDL30470.1 hypothetical protein BP5553_10348 [Venustampulla echinocandica]